MGRYGCVTTAIAEAIKKAGYDVDPGKVCALLTQNGGYTDRSYKFGPGLLNWWNIAKAFPQWSWEVGSSKAYQFIQVNTSYGEHWILLYSGIYFDPADGSERNSLKATYKPTGRIISANIAPAVINVPVEVPSTPAPPAYSEPTATPPVPTTKWVKFTTGLNIRTEPRIAPETYLFSYPKGTEVEIDGYIEGPAVEGDTRWCVSHRNKRVFSAHYTVEIPGPNL